ncbi:MAG: NAD(P)-dependent glycerol-1-phosphate dehydrogenase [Methanobacteriaceae archaeon]|nr:NAD(P)-dependent glycerol-1-phosphate dehydrogenase [Methanobacteriaceae archaeon]
MDFRNVQLPRNIHTGPGILKDTGSLCKELKIKNKILLISGNKTLKIAGEKITEVLLNDNYDVKVEVINNATPEVVDEITDILENYNAILGVGGGKVIDVAKLAATNKDKPFISIPTTAAHDGIASPRASIKQPDRNVSLQANAPHAIIADTKIISEAPFRFLSAGVGDIVSNLTAVEDWKLAYKLLNVPFSDSAAALSSMTADLTINTSDQIKEGLVESAAIVVKGLISSGMAISIANTSRPASGSEHKFSHALDKIAKKPALHGEQCGVGTIMMSYLQGGNWKKIKTVLEKVKAPTTAKELNIDPDDIISALTQAHTIRKNRYTILGDRGLTQEAAENIATNTHVI